MKKTTVESTGVVSQGVETEESIDLDAVRQDYTILDRHRSLPRFNGRVITYDDLSPTGDIPECVVRVHRKGLSWLRFATFFQDMLFAWQLLRQANRHDVLLVNGGGTVGKLVGLLNYCLPFRRRIVVMHDLFCEGHSRLKQVLIRWMVRGCDTIVVFSRHQVKNHAAFLNDRTDRFVYIPYKANHSKRPAIEMPIGNYVFSGGNTKRDYRTLFAAVRGTGIPLIVSATDPRVTAGLQVPSNVIVLKAVEPAFARLTAGSRFAVVPIVKNIIRSAGEANVCNAMWHGKPVIVADDVSLGDYVEDGVTGYVVAAGDVAMLRQRIVSLWNDADLVGEMGCRAQQRVAESLTHVDFGRRLIRIAILVGASRIGDLNEK